MVRAASSESGANSSRARRMPMRAYSLVFILGLSMASMTSRYSSLLALAFSSAALRLASSGAPSCSISAMRGLAQLGLRLRGALSRLPMVGLTGGLSMSGDLLSAIFELDLALGSNTGGAVNSMRRTRGFGDHAGFATELLQERHYRLLL